MRVDSHGDAGEGERLWGLPVGHVLTEADVRDIKNLISDFNAEMEESVEVYHQARQQVLFELGGQALVDTVNSDDLSMVEDAIQSALKKYHNAMAAKRAAAN